MSSAIHFSLLMGPVIPIPVPAMMINAFEEGRDPVLRKSNRLRKVRQTLLSDSQALALFMKSLDDLPDLQT